MYIKTSTGCDGFQAVAYADASEDRVIHRVMYDDALLHNEWVRTSIGSDLEKRIEHKGEKLALQKLLDEMVERKQISVADALAEMAKFMGGDEAYPEPEPTPEPDKPKLAYAEGDKVMVYGEIVRVDEDDAEYPYLVRVNNVGADWVYPSDIAGKVEPDVKEESKPEPKFKVGDKVIHKFKPEWGVGTVRGHTTDIPGLPEYFESSKFSRRYVDQAYDVEYPHFFIDRALVQRIETWTTAEENLVLA